MIIEVEIQSRTSPAPPEEKDATQYYDAEIDLAEAGVPRPKDHKKHMRNKNERNGNILRA